MIKAWLNIRAFAVSLFVSRPVSRGYDYWYYWKGRLVSRYYIEMCKGIKEIHDNTWKEYFFNTENNINNDTN